MKNLLNNKLLQQILLWSFLIVAAVAATFSLAYSTNFAFFDGDTNALVAASNYTKVGEPVPANLTQILDNYAKFVDKFNSVNSYLLVSQLLIVCLFAVLCVLGNKYRKKYYISNLVGGVAAGGIALVLNVVGIILNSQVVSSFNDNKDYLRVCKKAYDVNNYTSFNTVIQTVMMIFLIIGAVLSVLLICFTILKFIVNRSFDATEEVSEEEVSI